MAKNSIRVCSKRDDEKEKKCRKRIGGFLRLIGYKCPITDRATLRAEAESKLNEINERNKRINKIGQEYSSSCSEIKKLVPSRLNNCAVKCVRKFNVVNHHENTKINPVKVRSYVEKIMRKLGGGGAAEEEEMELVFEKILTPSDVNKSQGRLLMPLKQVQRQDVLNEIMERENKRVDVYVYDMSSSSMGAEELHKHDYCYELCLGRWDMNGNRNYALKYHWNQVVKENGLGKNMMVQLWSFRVGDGIPCLLLVPADSGGDGGETDDEDGGYKRR